MKTAFFIIESPMQMMSAIEAKHYFKPDKSILFIRYNNEERNDKQIRKLLSYCDFEKKFSFTIKEGDKFAYIKLLYVYILLLFFHPCTLFVGDYKANFMKMIYRLFKKENCIFLDDGAQSSYIFHNDPQANMFSYFKFHIEHNSPRLYVHNSFDFFRSRINKSNKEILSDTIYFIGAPLVEKNIISETLFHCYFSAIFKHYEELNIKVIYLPHRHESTNKISKYKNVEVLLIDVPIELYMLYSEKLPIGVSSFYSAALYTIHLLFSDYIKMIQAFYIPPSILNINIDIQEKVEGVYKMLEEEINVIYNYKDNTDVSFS